MTSSEYINTDIVGSAGSIGTYIDTVNDRLRALAPDFIPTADRLLDEWQQFTAQAPTQVPSRLTMRAVTTPQAANQAAEQIDIEAYLPLGPDVGLAYLASNAVDRQSLLPIDHMNETVSAVARAVQERFRSPASRLAELTERGYSFVDYIPDEAQLQRLWGPTFGWTATQVRNLSQRLLENTQLPPEQRAFWFTGAIRAGRLVAAALAERLDVPGPDGPIPTIESTEWKVDETERRNGLAAGMLALNTSQCLRDLPSACMLAECRYSTTAYGAGMSIGFGVPDCPPHPQVLARNVWVDGELADFVPITLNDQAADLHYGPADLTVMLNHLNQPTNSL